MGRSLRSQGADQTAYGTRTSTSARAGRPVPHELSPSWAIDQQDGLGNAGVRGILQAFVEAGTATDDETTEVPIALRLERLVRARALSELATVGAHIEERRDALAGGVGGAVADEIRQGAVIAAGLQGLAERLEDDRRTLHRVGAVALVSTAGERRLHRLHQRLDAATAEGRSRLVQSQLDDVRRVSPEGATLHAERARIAGAAFAMAQWRQRQVDGIQAALLKIYEQYPLFARLDPGAAATIGSDARLVEGARVAFDDTLAAHAEVVGRIESGDIHPFDLPMAIDDVRALLSEGTAQQLDEAVDAHQAREFWTDMGLTALEMGLLLVPVVGPFVAAGVGVYSVSRSVERIMDRTALADASIRPDRTVLGSGGPSAFEWTMLAVEVALTAVDLGGVARQLRGAGSVRAIRRADLDPGTHLGPLRDASAAVEAAEPAGVQVRRLGQGEVPAGMEPDAVAIRLDRWGRANGLLVGPEVTDGLAVQIHIELAQKLESRMFRMRLWLDSVVRRLHDPGLTLRELQSARLEALKQQMMVDRYLQAIDELPLSRIEVEELLESLESVSGWQAHWESVIAGSAHATDFDPSSIFMPGRRKGARRAAPRLTPEETAEVRRAASDTATTLLGRASAYVEPTTEAVSDAVSRAGGTLLPTSHVLKGHDSLVRKLTDRARPNKVRSVGAEAAVEAVAGNAANDVLRFGQILPFDGFSRGVLEFRRRMEELGYSFEKAYNPYARLARGESEHAHRGINDTFLTPDGRQRFEVQHHHPESHRAWDEGHLDYEVARDTSRTSAERRAADDRQMQRAASVPTPTGAAAVPEG